MSGHPVIMTRMSKEHASKQVHADSTPVFAPWPLVPSASAQPRANLTDLDY
jgi:hypothetical protein